MGLRFKLQLVAIGDDGVSIDELVVLTKGHERLEQVGLTLAEAKALLLEAQRRIVTRQVGPCSWPRVRPARAAGDAVVPRITRPSCSELCLASSNWPAHGSVAVRVTTTGRHPPVRSSSYSQNTPHPSCCISKASGPRSSPTDSRSKRSAISCPSMQP